jgi:hypothetical protein
MTAGDGERGQGGDGAPAQALPGTWPSDMPGSAVQSYEELLADIKLRIRSAQTRTARAINSELIEVNWQIGREILRRQQREGPELGRRTRGVVQRLSADLAPPSQTRADTPYPISI